jgi:aspartyl/asparaginyl beta-hydroxylase (cupin superfamily)
VTSALTVHARAQAGLQRFFSYVDLLSRGISIKEIDQYPGLDSRTFHDPDRFPIVRELQNSYSVLRSELLGLSASTFHPETEQVHRIGSWEVLHLYERGRKDEENCRLCPSTVKIIESHDTLRTTAGMVYVSKMKPGTHIAAHCGPTNIRIRCHLGIQIPSRNCALRVGDQERTWQEGKCLVFDDSLDHESWNYSNGDRVVLIVDLWHPDLEPDEIFLLEGLHRYGAAQAKSLIAYWNSNAKARRTRPIGYD